MNIINIKLLFFILLWLFVVLSLNGEMTFGSDSETSSDREDYFLTKCKNKENDEALEHYEHRDCFRSDKSLTSYKCRYLTTKQKNLYLKLVKMLNSDSKEKVPIILEKDLSKDKNNAHYQHSIICSDLLIKIVQEKYSAEVFEKIYKICQKFKEQDSSYYVLVAVRYGRIDILKKLKNSGYEIASAAKYAVEECQKDVYLYSIKDYSEHFSKTRWGYYLSRINSYPVVYASVALPSDDIEIIKPFIESKSFKVNLGINMDFPSDNTNGQRKKLVKQKNLIITPLFSALSGVLGAGYGRVYKGNSLPVIKYLITQGAVINSETMKGFSPYSLVKSSARTEKEKQQIIQYLKNELKIKDEGKNFNFDDWKCKFIHHTPCF